MTTFPSSSRLSTRASRCRTTSWSASLQTRPAIVCLPVTPSSDALASVQIRPGTAADTRACHDLLWASIVDFGAHNGTPLAGSADDWWRNSEPVHRYLSDHNAEWWVAEVPSSRVIIGYARAIQREGLFELTEFFVRPGHQSAGVGRSLIERAFPIGRGEIRCIIATRDVRALGRYYRAGTVARFPILTLAGTPVGHGAGQSGDDLKAIRLEITDRGDAADIERAVVGFARDEAEFRWLLSTREAYIYRRGDRAIGLAVVGRDGAGPVAVLDPQHLPEILLHVEARAAALDVARLEIQVPSINEVAVRHLLARGFAIDPWINYLMSDRPFGRFDRYVGFSSAIIL
jgi:GNAT superfamily N-acetyltransferase